MGAVYRATDTKLGRDVALKVTSDEFTDPSSLGFDDSPPFRGRPVPTYPAFYGLRREAGRPVQPAKYFARS